MAPPPPPPQHYIVDLFQMTSPEKDYERLMSGMEEAEMCQPSLFWQVVSTVPPGGFYTEDETGPSGFPVGSQ